MSGPSAMRAAIAKAMRDGGYCDAIRSAGAELDRVRRYIDAFSGDASSSCALPMQNPKYPCFPGLRNRPFHDPAEVPGARALEQAFDVIRDDYLALEDDAYFRYTPPSMVNLWAVHLLWYMGVDLEGYARRCRRTREILRALPRVCLDYPWGDALISVHAADSHLKPHCSIDNLRLRCHLGIVVPPGCEMRVAAQTVTWQQGRALVFEDSFEHEVWNRGAARRAILIVDFWHPDLTDVEIRALTAGFRKPEVRRLFYRERVGAVADLPGTFDGFLEDALRAQDGDPALKEFWR